MKQPSSIHNGKLASLFHDLYSKKITPEKALKDFKFLPYQDLGFAKTDTHRSSRTGFPEVILCEGKTPKQVAAIAKKLFEAHGFAIGTRAGAQHAAELKKVVKPVEYDDQSR